MQSNLTLWYRTLIGAPRDINKRLNYPHLFLSLASEILKYLSNMLCPVFNILGNVLILISNYIVPVLPLGRHITQTMSIAEYFYSLFFFVLS